MSRGWAESDRPEPCRAPLTTSFLPGRESLLARNPPGIDKTATFFLDNPQESSPSEE